MDEYELLKQLQAIEVANKVSQDVMKEMTDMMSKMMKALDAACVYCSSTDTDTWVATVCGVGHVISVRICKNCRNNDGNRPGLVNKCYKCREETTDWAVKSDEMNQWLTSWGELIELPELHPSHLT